MKIQTVTIKYDKKQDRILLLARKANDVLVLGLTRRLTFALLSALASLIQKSQGDQRIAAAGLQSEMLSMKHAQAISQIRADQGETPRPAAASRQLPGRLLTRIDIREDPDGRLLVFRDASGPVAQLTIDARQMHWFIGRLATHSRSAGWGNAIPMPDWLDSDVMTEFSAAQARTHSVH